MYSKFHNDIIGILHSRNCDYIELLGLGSVSSTSY